MYRIRWEGIGDTSRIELKIGQQKFVLDIKNNNKTNAIFLKLVLIDFIIFVLKIYGKIFIKYINNPMYKKQKLLHLMLLNL